MWGACAVFNHKFEQGKRKRDFILYLTKDAILGHQIVDHTNNCCQNV